jgi:hypothetical protein
LIDSEGNVDTLPQFRRTVAAAGLEGTVIGVIGASESVAQNWSTPLGFVFIDGGHSAEAAHTDLRRWGAHVVPGGYLAIHDVFPDPADGGRPPFDIYQEALSSGRFEERSATGSLRVLQKVAG